jgi:hypothetical protein
MQTLESLNMSLTALKSLLSDYALRANQAEALLGRMFSDKLTPEQVAELIKTVSEQMHVRASERVVQQQALIQATLVSLEVGLQGDAEGLRATVANVVKSLTLSQSHMNASSKKTTSATTVNSENANLDPK